VTDLNKKSDESKNFALKRRKLAQQLTRKMTRTMAVRCWFDEISEHLKIDTAAGIQRYVEPVSDEAAAIVAARRWRDYRAGNHFPCQSVVKTVENFCPSANVILTSPLWDALRLDRDPRDVAKRLLGKTSKLGDDLLISALNRFKCRGNHRQWVPKRCRDLILQGSLEGMATLLVCMKLAVRSDRPESLTRGFFASAVASFIVLSRWMSDRGVDHIVVYLFREILLPEYCGDYRGSRTTISVGLPRFITEIRAIAFNDHVRRPRAKISRAEAITILEDIQRSQISWC
jgi:hypothetical protein